MDSSTPGPDRSDPEAVWEIELGRDALEVAPSPVLRIRFDGDVVFEMTGEVVIQVGVWEVMAALVERANSNPAPLPRELAEWVARRRHPMLVVDPRVSAKPHVWDEPKAAVDALVGPAKKVVDLMAALEDSVAAAKAARMAAES